MNLKVHLSVCKVTDIDFESLLQKGKSVFLFDFDNTISFWKSSEIPKDIVQLFELLKSRGAMIFIVSNGSSRKLNYEIPAIWRAMKPLTWKVKLKLRNFLREKDKVVVVGDQLFTDVLFGNLLGAYTIKVEPLDLKREFLSTKILRFFERLVFGRVRKNSEKEH